MRIIHYLNQFFGGIGAEEQAGSALEIRDGAVGPGKLLETLLGDDARVVLTIVCGDNYAVEHQAEILKIVLNKIGALEPDLFVAGPCFDAGRYGMAAGALCSAVQTELGIHVLAKMANLGKKLVSKETIGLPAAEGYLPRGLLRDQVVEKKAATRLVDMLVAKLKGERFESEMPATAFAPVPMPAAVTDLSKARVMLITDGGLVPKGNPDRIEGTAATRWGAYRIEGRDDLRAEDYEVSHGGYDTRFVQEDPDRLVPLDAMREMEKNGVIGKLHDEFISTCGRSNPLSNTRRLGREIAEKIKRDGVDAVILTST